MSAVFCVAAAASRSLLSAYALRSPSVRRTLQGCAFLSAGTITRETPVVFCSLTPRHPRPCPPPQQGGRKCPCLSVPCDQRPFEGV